MIGKSNGKFPDTAPCCRREDVTVVRSDPLEEVICRRVSVESIQHTGFAERYGRVVTDVFMLSNLVKKGILLRILDPEERDCCITEWNYFVEGYCCVPFDTQYFPSSKDSAGTRKSAMTVI